MNEIKNLKPNRIVVVGNNYENNKVKYIFDTLEDFILTNFTSQKRV